MNEGALLPFSIFIQPETPGDGMVLESGSLSR